MTIPSISPEQAQALLADGAVLVDIRNHDEHAREHIPGAVLWPVSQPAAPLPKGTAKTVVFHCRSGARTQANAATLAAAAGCDAFLLSGFVGAGLVFAGVSGFCGMARLLAWMPWNRRTVP